MSKKRIWHTWMRPREDMIKAVVVAIIASREGESAFSPQEEAAIAWDIVYRKHIRVSWRPPQPSPADFRVAMQPTKERFIRDVVKRLEAFDG